MTPKASNNHSQKSSGWQSILIWAVIAILLRWQVIEPRWIPSGSMLPTLQLQDRILVEKVRPRFTSIQKNHLKRGSVVVFSPPTALIAAGYDENSALIKRLVGLPGDQVEVRNGEIFVNGVLIQEPWRKDPINYEMEPVIVTKNHLWVLGDNHNSSLDSHVWGELDETKVIGTAIFRYWPLERFGPIRFPPPD